MPRRQPWLLFLALALLAPAGATAAPPDSGPGTEPQPLLCGGLAPTIVGTPGHDVIDGTAGPDVIAGLSGNDEIRGRNGEDVICGGPGNDTIEGDTPQPYSGRGVGYDDTLHGDDGLDTLRGNSGNDDLRGGADGDTLNGQEGHDVLDGSFGPDRVPHRRRGCPVVLRRRP